jgi:hypothetical protein
MLSSSMTCSACKEKDCVSAAMLEEYCAELDVFRGRDRRSLREGEQEREELADITAGAPR